MSLRRDPCPPSPGSQARGWLLTLCLCAATLALYAGRGHAQSAPLEELSAFPQTSLAIRSGKTTHAFTVWVADTASRDEQGLMFVRDLPSDRGMVFIGEQPRVWKMWMRNTYIPLDMLFVALDGHIVKIAHAIPHDDTNISSDVEVHAVIELAGGVTDQLHIKVGDVAKWKAVPPDPTRAHILSNP